jgi:hypothetical protein
LKTKHATLIRKDPNTQNSVEKIALGSPKTDKNYNFRGGDKSTNDASSNNAITKRTSSGAPTEHRSKISSEEGKLIDLNLKQQYNKSIVPISVVCLSAG